MNHISLRQLPNRKVCPIPNCGCTPVMGKQGYNNPFNISTRAVVFVDVPFCAKTKESLASLEEAAYAELLACRSFLCENDAVTGEQAKIVRRILGFDREEMAKLGISSERAEEKIHAHSSYTMLLLGFVVKQIHKYES